MSTNAAQTVHGSSLTPSHWGMLSFLLSEVAFFSTLIAVYVSYMGKDVR